MKTNNLSLLFLKLYLKNNLNLAGKFKLKSVFKIKSFYKNEENLIVKNLNELNQNLLYKFYINIYNLYFFYKIFLYKNIKKNNFMFKNKITSSYSVFYDKITEKKYLCTFENLNFNKSYNSFFILSLFYFYSIYFTFMTTLKLYTGINLKSSKLPNRISKITLLRSPHIDKKSREQFEILTHTNNVKLLNFFGNKIKGVISKINNNSYIEISI